MGKMSFQAHLRYLLTTDVAAFLLAALLVLLASRIRALISSLAALVVILALAAAFGGDVALWLHRGIRSIELDEHTITLFRGRELKAQVINKADIASLETKRRFMRRVALLRLPRSHVVRITEEAFSQEAFSRFLSVLAGWNQGN